MLIDTHSHLNFAAFDDDLDEVTRRSFDAEIWIINVGTNYQSSKRAVKIAEKYPEEMRAAIGLHPISLDTGLIKNRNSKESENVLEKNFDYGKYKKLVQSSKKVAAIGEIGLDYYHKPKSKKKLELFKKKQKELLLKQLELAKELKLPVILHCRFAHNDLIEILAHHPSTGVIHCFTGNWKQAKKYLDLGFYLGFNGIIFKLDLIEVIKKTPLEKILLETDCPYLTPTKAKRKRNEPLYIKYIAEKIAEIKNTSFEKVSETTTANAKKLFRY